MAWSEWKKFSGGTLTMVDSGSKSNTSTTTTKRLLLDKTLSITESGNYVISVTLSGKYQTSTSDDIAVYKNGELISPLAKNGSYSKAQPRNNLYNVECSVNDNINIKSYVANDCEFTIFYNLLRIE